MTTHVTHPYIVRTRALDTKWINPSSSLSSYNAHLLPQLVDEQWRSAFNDASDLQKHNLASAWLWSYAVKCERGEFDKYGKNKAWCLEKNATWIKQIEPYIAHNIESELRSDETMYASIVNRLLYRNYQKDVGRECKNKLWFGTDAEKLEALVKASEDHELMQRLAQSEEMHNRVWEVTEIPSATPMHKQVIMYVIAMMGFMSEKTTPAINQSFLDWHRLGRLADQWAPQYPNEEQKFKRLENFIHAQDPKLALPVFTRLVETLRAGGASLKGLTYPCGTVEFGRLDDENLYEVMNHWFPSFSQQWAVANTLGLSLSDAAEYVLAPDGVAKNTVKVNLPDNLEQELSF